MSIKSYMSNALYIGWLICMFTYMTMRVISMGVYLAYLIHVKPRYMSYCEGMSHANNWWKHV